MALKDSWNDKVNGKDIVDAEDINSIARAVIEIEERETGGFAETDPTVPSWAKESKKPTYTADEVGADKSGTASSAVSTHNVNTSAHNDIRLLIEGLTTRLNALANSDDTTLDQMAEVVAYIKDNRELLEQVTTGKVSVEDIVDNLVTNVKNKPLSAAQGVALKALIDAITVPTKLSQLTNDSGYIKATGLSLGIASDGLVYLFVGGEPVGTGIPQGQSADVYGYIDENNHIVLEGVKEGSYTFAFVKEDGSTIFGGAFERDDNTYYSVTSNLTNCTIDNATKTVAEGESYSSTITANDGYELSSVSVTMGGSAVSVTNGVISIASVTGDIVITAVAEEIVIVNLIPISKDASGNAYNGTQGYKANTRIRTSNGEEQTSTDKEATGFMPIQYGQTIYIKGIEATDDSSNTIALYDENHTFIAGNFIPSFMSGVASGTGVALTGEYKHQTLTVDKWKSSQGKLTADSPVAYFRLSANKIDGNSIVTVNEEIS